MKTLENNNYLICKFFLFTIIIIVPLFDSATGFLVRGESLSAGGLGTPSQLIRFLLIGLSIILLQSKRAYLLLFLASAYLFSIEAISFLAHQSLQGFAIGVVFAYKFIFSAFIYFALKTVFKELNYSEKDIIILIYRSSLVLCLAFLLGDVIAVKVGISDSFVRSSGLFSSGNGLGVLLGVSSLLISYGFQKSYLNKGKHYIVYILCLLCLVLIATKASAIFIIINLYFLIANLRFIYKLLITSILVCFVAVFYQNIINLLSVSFELAIYRFDNKTSWSNFFLSAREDYIDNALHTFNQSNFKALRVIFGSGSFLSYELPSNYTMAYKMMEMDSFDTFFMYGILGCIFYLSLMIYCIIKASKKSRIITFTVIALFLHSMFAGHTMYNGLSTMGLVYILLIINSTNNKTMLLDVQNNNIKYINN